MLYEVITDGDHEAQVGLDHLLLGLGRADLPLLDDGHDPLRITSYNVCYTKLLRELYNLGLTISIYQSQNSSQIKS